MTTRVAGRGRRPGGAVVTWTVAEGRRGRRWREVVEFDGAVRWSLLYETDPGGAFSHLELATRDGLATLHPEPDGTLHGNIVDRDGVRHIDGVAFAPGSPLLVDASLVAGAVLSSALGPGPAWPLEVMTLEPATLRLRSRPVVPADLQPIDARGVPVLAGGAVWPLERDNDPGRG